MTTSRKNFVWADDEAICLLTTLAQLTRIRKHVILRALLRQAYEMALVIPTTGGTPRELFVRAFPNLAPVEPQSGNSPAPADQGE